MNIVQQISKRKKLQSNPSLWFKFILLTHPCGSITNFSIRSNIYIGTQDLPLRYHDISSWIFTCSIAVKLLTLCFNDCLKSVWNLVMVSKTFIKLTVWLASTDKMRHVLILAYTILHFHLVSIRKLERINLTSTVFSGLQYIWLFRKCCIASQIWFYWGK